MGNEFEGVVLKGIGSDYNNTFIQEHIVEGELPIFTDSAATNKIVLSRLLTQKLWVKLGDKIDIYFMQDGIKARRMTLAAIYETHLSEMDAMLALTDAYGDMKSKADGEIFLDTAEFLILSPDVPITAEFYEIFRPACKLVFSDTPPDLETISDYLAIHTPKTTLASIRAIG